MGVHSDTEADDLWQNATMYLRTQDPGHHRLAAQWARFFTDEYPYRSDGWAYAWNGVSEDDRVERPSITIPLTAADTRYLGVAADGKVDVLHWGADHYYGAGLPDWYLVTGDAAEASLRVHGLRKPGSGGWRGRARGIARHRLPVTRL